MSYKIPSDDRLAEAIFVVMYRNQQVISQRNMANLVLKELEKDGETYRVSGERIRRLAVNRGMATLIIDYAEKEGEYIFPAEYRKTDLAGCSRHDPPESQRRNSSRDSGSVRFS